MGTIDLMNLMGQMGVVYNSSQIHNIHIYIRNMIKDNRVLIIRKDGEPFTIVFFSIGNDWYKFFIKGQYEYLPQDIEGNTIYFEKAISKKWNREIRGLIEDLITATYPQIEYGVWHRPAKWGDRKVTTKRRLNHVRD